MASVAVAGLVASSATVWWQWRRASRPPEVYAGRHPGLRAVLARLDGSLREPLVPPVWCYAWWAQMAALIALEPLRRAPALGFDLQRLAMPDGGECALAWAKEPAASAPLPSDAPVLCIFHTITGNLQHKTLHRLCSCALARGFRPVVLLRRGHFGPLRTAKFHIVGHVEDARRQLRAAGEAHPGVPLVALGASAGTGVLVRMAGEDGAGTPLRAAVCICPGFDTGPGQFFKKIWPVSVPYMKRAVTSFFLEGEHKDVIAEAAGKHAHVAEAVRAAKEAADFEEFYEALAPLGGWGSAEEMHADTNPMATARCIKAFGLVISARDDPVCTMAPEYIGDPLFDGGHDPRALVLTSTGAHCAFFDGWSGASVLSARETWAERLGFDFLQAALDELSSSQGSS